MHTYNTRLVPHWFVPVLVWLLLGIFGASVVMGQDPEDDRMSKRLDEALRKQREKAIDEADFTGFFDMMRKNLTWMTPGEGHKSLKQFTGSFMSTGRMWYVTDGQEIEIKTSGYSRADMIYGGRFVQSTGHHRVMDFEFDETTIIGFDPEQDRYTMIFFNSLNTVLMVCRARAGEGSLIFHGEGLSPYDDCTGRFQIRCDVISENEFVSVMYYETEKGTWRRYNETKSVRIAPTDPE